MYKLKKTWLKTGSKNKLDLYVFIVFLLQI